MKKQKVDNLDSESQRFYDRISREYQLTSAGTELLLLAAFTLSRWRQAKTILDKEGLFIEGKIGRLNPVCKCEHDARLSFVRMLKELNLDAETDGVFNESKDKILHAKR